jgi:hypothetical protein
LKSLGAFLEATHKPLDIWNENSGPFVWTKSAEQILKALLPSMNRCTCIGRWLVRQVQAIDDERLSRRRHEVAANLIRQLPGSTEAPSVYFNIH